MTVRVHAGVRHVALNLLLAVAMLLAVVVAPPGGAAEPAVAAALPKVSLPVEKYTLPNGLEVILSRDPRASTVATNLWYHVGAANETAGRTGFAHLFEHMMFEGSGHVPEGTIDRTTEALGAWNNASTDFDYTNYLIADLPSDSLELALWLESDRMGFLLDRLDQASLDTQKAVVRSERRQNWEQPPYALTYEEVFRQLFPEGHPYRPAVIGSHADIQSAELEDFRQFFSTFYVPNNATLAVAGNFDPARARSWIKKYFGTIPAAPEPPAPAITVPKITAEKRVVLTDEVELPKVTMAWLAPPAYGKGSAAAEVAAGVLGGGESSRLYTELVRKRKIAQEVSAYQWSAAHPSVFFLEAVAKPGHSAADLEKAIDEILTGLRAQGPTAAELSAARTTIVSDLVRGLESVGDFGGRADLLNRYNHFVGHPKYLAADIARYGAVSAADVKAFAGGTLADHARVVAHTVPGKKVLPPDPPAPAGTAAATKPVPSKEPWRNKQPGPSAAPEAALPSVRRFTLGNGMPVFLVASHGLPVVTASVWSRHGSSSDPRGLAGLAGFTAQMLRQGTKQRTADEIAAEVAAFGGVLQTGADLDGSRVSVQALSPQAGRAVALVAQLVRSPAFRRADVERVRGDLKVALAQQADDPVATARALLMPAVYGKGHPYGHQTIGTRKGILKVTRADLVRFQHDAFTPTTSALVLAGDLTPTQAKELAEKAFGGWRGSGTPPVVPGPGKPARERIVLVDYPGASQTALRVGQAAIGRSHPDHERLEVANRVLGGLFSSRLSQNLRETRGYTYGAYSGLRLARGPAPFVALATVTAKHTGESVRQILLELRRLRRTEVTAEELRRAKDSLARSVPSLFGTTASAAATAGELYLYDLGAGYYAGLADRVARFTATDLRRAAVQYLDPASMRIVAAGDRRTIGPQLRKLHLGPIAVRRPNGTLAEPEG